jgi:hypothetical protein
MKGLSKTVSKLSPKAQRKKENSPSNVAQLQVCHILLRFMGSPISGN